MLNNQLSPSDIEQLFLYDFSNRVYPAFVIEDESKKIVYANTIIRERHGDVVGKFCYEAFCKASEPCTCCPERQHEERRYAWEAFDEKTGRAYKICNFWKAYEGTLCRLVMAADTSEIMNLNRSVVDYLWLMQQLSEMQVNIMNDQPHIAKIVLLFLRKHFDMQAVAVEYRTDTGVYRYICNEREVRELSEHEVLPQGGEKIDMQVTEAQLVLVTYGIKLVDDWNENKEIILGIVQVYLENYLLRRRSEWENQHDKATGLYNRAAFRKHTQERLTEWQELTAVFLDLDNLKQINDTYGHDMGDRIICATANALLAVSGDESMAYRMGGDEFILLCHCGLADTERLCEEFENQLYKSCRDFPLETINISRGMAYSTAPHDIEKAVREADAKMYENKRVKKLGRAEWVDQQ